MLGSLSALTLPSTAPPSLPQPPSLTLRPVEEVEVAALDGRHLAVFVRLSFGVRHRRRMGQRTGRRGESEGAGGGDEAAQAGEGTAEGDDGAEGVG